MSGAVAREKIIQKSDSGDHAKGNQYAADIKKHPQRLIHGIHADHSADGTLQKIGDAFKQPGFSCLGIGTDGHAGHCQVFFAGLDHGFNGVGEGGYNVHLHGCIPGKCPEPADRIRHRGFRQHPDNKAADFLHLFFAGTEMCNLVGLAVTHDNICLAVQERLD